MKKRRKKNDSAFLRALDLPEESGGRVPRVTLVGVGFAMIENHRGVYQCGLDCVRLVTEAGLLTVKGGELCINELSADRLCISGNITGIEYDDKVKRAPKWQ